MIIRIGQRGFKALFHEQYPPKDEAGAILQESSAVGDYEDSWDKPGSSYLWVGCNFHLNREQAKDLARHIMTWVKTGRLVENPPPVPPEKE